jgi:hypothetical protein
MVTTASRHGAEAGCPSTGESFANCSSWYTAPSASRSRIASVPFGHAARATRIVSSGMLPNACGYIDIMGLLPQALFTNLVPALYHSSMTGIRQQ